MDHPAYGIFYMISFMLVEKISTETHLIHSFVDDLIPFCEYFIIPYVLWFLVVLGSVMYFALGSPGKKEYYQYMATLGVGMTLFLIISFVYPNGQNLRPELTGEVLLFRLCSFCTRQIPPQIFFRVFMYLMQLPVVWLF